MVVCVGVHTTATQSIPNGCRSSSRPFDTGIHIHMFYTYLCMSHRGIDIDHGINIV
jgi:hypothetical protein